MTSGTENAEGEQRSAGVGALRLLVAPGLAVLRAAAVLPGPVLVRTRTGTLRARTLRTGTLGARTLRTRTLRTGALRTGTLLLSGALRTGTLLLSGPPGQVEPCGGC